LAYLIFIGAILGFSAYVYLLETVRPALATSYAYVNPLVAVALGVWLGGEHVDALELVAMAVILGGVVMVYLPAFSRAAAPVQEEEPALPEEKI
jgi:drug/metabolite transporter (DMT)-like permease